MSGFRRFGWVTGSALFWLAVTFLLQQTADQLSAALGFTALRGMAAYRIPMLTQSAIAAVLAFTFVTVAQRFSAPRNVGIAVAIASLPLPAWLAFLSTGPSIQPAVLESLLYCTLLFLMPAAAALYASRRLPASLVGSPV